MHILCLGAAVVTSFRQSESEFGADGVGDGVGVVAHEGLGFGLDHNASEGFGTGVADDDAA